LENSFLSHVSNRFPANIEMMTRDAAIIVEIIKKEKRLADELINGNRG
jgi:hypothetical protein